MSDGLPIDGPMIDCEKSILSEQAALRLGPAWDGGAPPLASVPHFLCILRDALISCCTSISVAGLEPK